MQLRPHQIEVLNKTRLAIQGGSKRPLLFCPCSFGKTIVAAEISRLAVEKGGKVLFMLHRRLLCLQTKEKFDDYGLHSSIIMAGYETDFSAPVMITTIQTYSRRLMLEAPEVNRFFHDASIIFCDEAHLGISETYKKIYSFYKDRVIIGLTGTPARGDQRGLGEVFNCLVSSIGIKELTEKGFLAPIRYFAAPSPDLSGVKITAGDYNKGELQEKMNTTKLVGDIVENWLKIAEDRPTIVFSTGVKHSIYLRDEFRKVGIPTAHLDSKSPHEERMDVLDRFKNGDLTIVTNCQLFTEGYDADFVSCIAIARPTKSLPLWIQMSGRGQRVSKGRENCILLDFGGNIERHGPIELEREWVLDGKKRAFSKAKKEETVSVVKCMACHLVFMGGNICPDCGTKVVSFGKKISTIEAELEELEGKKKSVSVTDKRIYLGMLKYWVADKNKNPKMVIAKYKFRHGCWPHSSIKDVAPIEPDRAFLNLMKHDMIRYFKGKEKADKEAKKGLQRGGELIEGHNRDLYKALQES